MIGKSLLFVLALGIVAGCEVSQPFVDGARIAATGWATDGVAYLINAVVSAMLTI